MGMTIPAAPNTKRWAIYARKSNVQEGVTNNAKSVARQVDDARPFISGKGGTLEEHHVYVDDAVSGAFLSRPEFQRMLNDAERGEFDAIVFYDQDRFSRDARHTLESLYRLADLGIEVWDYSTGIQIDLYSPMGLMTATMRGIFAEQERAKIRKRVFDAHYHRVRLGHVVCAKVYGYDNVRVPEGAVKPDGHVIRVINEAEAAVVRQIYERFAAGEGSLVIAGVLNRAGIIPPRLAKPRKGHGGPRGWSNSTIRAVLERPLYRGVVVWGQNKVAYGREIGARVRKGTREAMQVRREGGPMFTRHDESLRIINADLAARVDARRVELYDRYCAWRKDKTRPMPDKTHGKYLLSGGMLKCPTCGRHFEARHNRKKGVALYMCSTRRRMPGMCSNDFSLPIEDADDDVLNIVEGQLLEPQIIEEVLKLVDDSVDKTTYVQSNRDRLQEEVNNLVDSIAKKFIAPEDAGAQIQRRKEEIARLDAELRKPRPPRVQRERLRAALEQRIASWKAELRAEPRIARIVLRRLIGPLTLHGEHRGPDETYFEYWEASIKPEGLLDGLVQVDQSQTTT